MWIPIFKAHKQWAELLEEYVLDNAKLIIDEDETSKEYRIKWAEHLGVD